MANPRTPARAPAPGETRDGARPAGRGQRQHILDTALTLMAQRGVDGTSMRDLAAAAGLNVASLYHYFPSKRDLLVAVLEERGLLGGLTDAGPEADDGDRNAEEVLGNLLNGMLGSMLEIEEFIRLMLGEVLRGDETALTVGTELMEGTLASLEQWLLEREPALSGAAGAPAVARLLRAWLIGIFFEYVAGVMTETEGDATADVFRRRANEAARVLHSAAPNE
jgi:AcrR family transcriptional regulator